MHTRNHPAQHLAQHLQGYGRGHDTMLVHMTPGEVGGLRALAQATGGDLTINPHTGLHEAGWLGKLLPTILGFALNFIPGVGPLLAAGLTAAGTTAVTGNLGKGLMAGLGAFGGAGLSGGLFANATGTIASNLGNVAVNAANTAVPSGAASAAAGQLGNVAGNAAINTAGVTGGLGGATLSSAATRALGATLPGVASAAPTIAGNVANIAGGLGGAPLTSAATNAFSSAIPGVASAAPAIAPAQIFSQIGSGAGTSAAPGFLDAYKTATSLKGLPLIGNSGPMLGALGVANSVGGAFKPAAGKTAEETTQYPYRGPYHTGPRKAVFPTAAEKAALGSKEWNYFPTPTTFYDGAGNQVITGAPESRAVPINAPNSILKGESQADYLARAQRYGFTPQNYAAGGKMPIQDGSFIVDARTVAELGNGSSGAGQDMLSRMGGMPIRGPGDGVSDSIHARIGGNQEARVARDEVKFGPEAVTRLGKGSHSRGTQKLYSLMDRAAKARKSAKRGQDTGLRRGLA